MQEIQEMFNLIGNITEQDKVIKLWDGLRDDIQESLWRNNYNPEISSWDEVVDQVEMLEIA